MSGRSLLSFLLAAAVFGGLPGPAAADVTSAPGLELVRVPSASTNFSSPVGTAFAPGSPDRVYVVERGGRVWIVDNGAVKPQPFLDLSSQVESTASGPPAGSENGMSSIAFAPDYGSSGRLYAFFTDRSLCRYGGAYCDDRLVELRRSAADPDVVGPDMRTLLVVPRTGEYAIHRGGQLAFGSDGQLYVSTGDGGPPRVAARDPNALNGKVLRLDPDAARPRPVVVAQGLRNPYRFSFDAVTDDLVLGDVGETRREEVDFIAREQTGAVDFGWPDCEGELAFPPDPNVTDAPCQLTPGPGYTPPALTYSHANSHCVVTGGFVARDDALPALAGRYLFGDYCAGEIRSARVDAAGATQDAATGLAVSGLTSFGQDGACRLYTTSLSGAVYRLEPSDPAAPAHGCPPPGPRRPRPAPDTGPSPAAGAAAPPAPAAGGPRPDRAAPVLGRVALRDARLKLGRATYARFSLSETATVAVRVYRVRPRRPHFILRWLMTRRLAGGPRKSVMLPSRLGGRLLSPGRYTVTLRARDAAGNASPGRTATFVVVAR
ncbi:MAG: hypothetical protein QOE65_492 [Solirubrobacteraceae bacterium]|nr:hypothetical protein [Solirubrobacteraceae bacterium]